MGFVPLVKRLFTFIEAVRSRNWELYLSSFEALIKDFTSFDRIKYRRWSAVYLADMYHLRDSEDMEDQKVWQAFSDFSCQKSEIPGTAIGRDHCGEQENKKIKNRGGIKGITMNQNSRTRHFLAAPVLASITDQMFDLGGRIVKTSSKRKHHQLNDSYIKRQNEAVNALLPILEEHVSFSELSSPLINIITGQLYSDEISRDLLSFEDVGNKLYKEFIDERLTAKSQSTTQSRK